MELASTNPVRLSLALTMMAWQQSKHYLVAAVRVALAAMLFTSLTASSHMSCSHTRNSNLKYQVQGQVVRTLATAAAPLLPLLLLPTTVCRCPSATGVHYRPTAFLLQANGCLAFRPPNLGPPARIIFRYSPISSPLCTSSFTFWLMWEHYFLLPLLCTAGPWLEGGMAGSVTSSFPSCMMGAGRPLSLFLLQPRAAAAEAAAAAPTMLPPSLSAHSPPNGKFEAVSNEPWTGTGPRPLMPKEAEYLWSPIAPFLALFRVNSGGHYFFSYLF